MKHSRTKTVHINSLVTLGSQIIQIILGFVIRKIFINYLGITYLGYNSVFTNILQMLNLADMGIGVAITSYLYKPLADKDITRITAIMGLYKKLYTLIGFIVLGVGVVASAFLDVLIPDATCGIWYLRILFLINLIGTVSTYFLAYKRTLLIADQKSFMTNIVDTVVYFIVAILQLLSLIFAPNYIVFLSLNIAKNIVSNIIISVKVGKEYKFINKEPSEKIIKEYKPQITQFVKDVFISKIGAAVYYSTDNIILSVIKGSLLTGYLSNYTLITTQLNTVVIAIFNSVQATFGNFINTTEDPVARLKMTDNYFCVNFCIGNFCMICFSLLAQPFVKIFFGENMLLSFSTALWLGINLMLTFLIQLPSQVFIIYKLFRYDRPIIIVSALLNIIISVFLAYKIGINGVLIGTFITSLMYLFSRFYVISKYVYEVAYWYYIKKILSYGIISSMAFFLTYFATKNLSDEDYIGFLLKAFVIGSVSILSTAFFLSFTKEFEFLKNKLIPGRAKKLCNKYILGGFTILIVTTSIFVAVGTTNQIGFSTACNKSYGRTDSYVAETNTRYNIFHLSFDDSIEVFKDINEKKYESAFQNSTLNWYKELHDKYGVVISCYVYYEDKNFNLSQFPDKYKNEFAENSDWLRFGFHTVNAETNYQSGDIVQDYQKTINELERIVGCGSIDNVVRLQMFKGSYEEVRKLSQLKNQPVVGLLTADDNRQSYYLSDIESHYIYCHDEYYDTDTGLFFYSTDFRTEYVESISSKLKELDSNSWNNQTGDLVVFSHEWALNMENKSKIEQVCKYAKEKGYRFDFFEDDDW